MKKESNKKLIIKVLLVGLIIATFSFLFHPEIGQFSIMMNGEPVANPLVRFAAIPTFLVIILITGVLIALLFLGVGAYIFMAVALIAFLVLAIALPFFWPILLIILLIIVLMSFSHNKAL